MCPQGAAPMIRKNRMSLLQDIGSSVQFLSRLPVPGFLTHQNTTDFTRCTWAFPVAGFIITLPALFVLAITSQTMLPIAVIVTLTLISQVFVTGGLHEDGLADCADGFGGGHTREKKLIIMKDSSIGTYGTLALIFAFLTRFAVLSALLTVSIALAMSAFLASQVLTRGALSLFWHSLPPARTEGLSQSLGQPSKGNTASAVLIAFLGTIIIALPQFPPINLICGLVAAALALFVFRRLCNRQIGGQTGDTIGAAQIIVEIAFLTGLLTFSG